MIEIEPHLIQSPFFMDFVLLQLNMILFEILLI